MIYKFTKKLLSLDLSTSCTGYSIFNMEHLSLIEYGTIVPNNKNLTKLLYPKQQLYRMLTLTKQIKDLIIRCEPDIILIEEIAGSKNRLSQKVLDGFHFVLLFELKEFIDKIVYKDVTGCNGWRNDLKMVLTKEDKIKNKERKELNKKIGKGQKKQPIISFKHLACRFANYQYRLNLNYDLDEKNGDIADSICLGYAYLRGLK